MRKARDFFLLAAAFAIAAWRGWWAIPAIAALWGVWRPAVWRPVLSAALAAGLGWAFWLAVDAGSDPGAFSRLAVQLGQVLGVPAPLLLFLTLLFPVLLAWSAAALGCGLAAQLAELLARRARVRARLAR